MQKSKVFLEKKDKQMQIIATNNDKLIKYLIHNIQGLSFGQAQKLLRKGDVKVNDKRTKENINISVGDKIDIYLVEKSKPTVDILYEDDNVLIVSKPAGIECATRDKSSDNTYSLEEIFEEKNAIVVHRLDRLTEGLVILAKTKEIASEFEKIFRTRQVKKHYIAGAFGEFKADGILKAYLKKDSKKSKVYVSENKTDNSKEIITEFHLNNYSNNISIIDVILHTGRTHQIRAHLSFLGYPIINDAKYAYKSNSQAIIDNTQMTITNEYSGYFLTASKIEFNITGQLNYLNNLTLEINPSWIPFAQKKDVR